MRMKTNHRRDWFLVQVKPNSHGLAYRNLKRQRISTFLPIHAITSRRGNRFVSELRPLFPGYLFVELEVQSPVWRKINSTYGVNRVVSFAGGMPAIVPKSFMDALLRRCDEDGRVLSSDQMLTGDRVEVVDGPFTDFVGTIEAIETGKRVWLLLDVLGQQARVQVGIEQVESL